MAQKFEKVKPNFNGKKRNLIPRGIAYAILTGDVQSAVDVLRLVDCDILYGDKMMTDIQSVAKFYGVTTDYARSVMGRYGITSKACPEHCKLMNRGQYARFANLEMRSDHKNPENSGWYLPDGRRFEGKTFQNAYYDPRAVLAFASLAFISRKVIPDSNAAKILKSLVKTRYYDMAKNAIKEYESSLHMYTTNEYGKTCHDVIVESDGVRSDNTGIVPVAQDIPVPAFEESHSEQTPVYIPVAIIPEIIKAIVPYLAK